VFHWENQSKTAAGSGNIILTKDVVSTENRRSAYDFMRGRNELMQSLKPGV